MRVYFNTNVYCRPFDDLNQERILSEATAILNLFLIASTRIIQIISSEMVLTEIYLIDSLAKREAIELLIINNSVECIKIDDGIKEFALKIKTLCKIDDYADCLHLALCCVGKCNYFIYL